MARRQRVPHRKEHRRKRNKNPKLSPFQREQRRAKLANQAPTLSLRGGQRDYPVSQRAVMEFLMERRQRRERRRAERQARREKREDAEVEGTDGEVSLQPPADMMNSSSLSPGKVADVSGSTTRKRKVKKLVEGGEKKQTNNKKAKKGSLITPVALNEQFAASLARPINAFKTVSGADEEEQEQTVDAIIARKKERKHRKKAEARRERVREMLRETEEKLKEVVLSSKSGKKRKNAERVDPKDVAFEKKLRQLQKEKAQEEKAVAAGAGAGKQRGAGNSKTEHDETQGNKRGRKQITFSDDCAGAESSSAPHKAMRYPNDKGAKVARDFCELADVVRYGDRVEAPPVFDTLPRHDASITRLAKRLEQGSKDSAKKNGAANIATSQKERLQLLSSLGGVGEQRRLERLGLGRPVGNKTAAANMTRKLSKEEEMQRLREAVMGAYRRKKRTGIEERKGVDMNHQFPLFS